MKDEGGGRRAKQQGYKRGGNSKLKIFKRL
jgi:hypothetical protein